MESLTDGGSPLGTDGVRQERVDSTPVAPRWTAHDGGLWLIAGAVQIQHTGGHKRIRPVAVLLKDGETWAVNGQSGDEFQVAVHATPVAGQWRTPKFGCLCVGDPVDECTCYPHPEAVLTCVDHGDCESCVVVVFDGWDDAEGLVRVTGAQRQLANTEG